MATTRLGLASAALVLATASCAGQAQPVPANPPGTTCSLFTQVQQTVPTPKSSGVPTNIGKVQVVVNASQDILGNQWNAVLTDQFGNSIQGGTFAVTTNSGGPHPFPHDYYYNASIPILSPGVTYGVYMNQLTSGCTPLFVNSFST